MKKELSIEEFIQAIEKLPDDEEQGQWIRWLSEYHTPGYYNRLVGKKRSAKLAYNHIANPEMLLWLIRAVGLEKKLGKLAESDYDSDANLNRISGVIRARVPWEALQPSLKAVPDKVTTNWLQYWKPFQIKPAITEPWLLDRSAGNQLVKVKPGDVVWIVSVEQPGRLITLGPIHVAKVLDQKKAQALLGPDIRPADWYVLAAKENAYRAEYTDLSPIASRLRFASEDFPRLILKQGKVSGTQFQQMRKLEPESAELISRVWQEAKSRSENIDDKLIRTLDRLAALDKKQATTIRLEQGILRQNLFGSASVMQCGICGRKYPASLTVVAHIKPRAKCSDLERRDKHNLMPLCLLGCDALFEQGFISVDKGRLVSGPNEGETKELKERVKTLVGSHCKYWSLESKKYFDWKAQHPRSVP